MRIDNVGGSNINEYIAQFDSFFVNPGEFWLEVAGAVAGANKFFWQDAVNISPLPQGDVFADPPFDPPITWQPAGISPRNRSFEIIGAAVPEPSSVALTVLTAAGVGVVALRRRRKVKETA